MDRIRLYVCKLLWLLALAIVVAAQEEQTLLATSNIQVADYLESMPDGELESICRERGFELAAREDGKPLVHEDYVEAARRCLSLENEMNAILAENPELAAELEAEVERMRKEKERLERERDEILAQKALLEEQLRAAGVDILANTSCNAEEDSRNISSVTVPGNQTLEQVLKESFVLLYQRVKQDVEFVGMVLRPILQPLGYISKFAWKHSKPVLLNFASRLRVKFQELRAKHKTPRPSASKAS